MSTLNIIYTIVFFGILATVLSAGDGIDKVRRKTVKRSRRRTKSGQMSHNCLTPMSAFIGAGKK